MPGSQSPTRITTIEALRSHTKAMIGLRLDLWSIAKLKGLVGYSHMPNIIVPLAYGRLTDLKPGKLR